MFKKSDGHGLKICLQIYKLPLMSSLYSVMNLLTKSYNQYVDTLGKI